LLETPYGTISSQAFKEGSTTIENTEYQEVSRVGNSIPEAQGLRK